MQIHSIESFSGKNIHSHRPVIKMIIDLGELIEKPTKDIEGFNETLLDLFPGLKKHYCSLGYEGGFADRLKEGTYIGHVTEHLILELQTLLGHKVRYGKTRVIKEPSLYYIIVEYVNERTGVECCRAGVNIISSIASGQAIDKKGIMEYLKKVTQETELGPSTRAIFEEAKKRNIPVTRLGCESLIQLGYGRHSRRIAASLSDKASCIAVDIAGSKHMTKQILEENKIPVPKGDIAYTVETAISIAEEIGYPVVVKPYNANQGKGVTLDVENKEQVRVAYGEAMNYGKIVIVEKYIKGNDYRVLVVGNNVSAVSERRPPAVIGDGIHTIKELVKKENNNPLRGDDHEKPLTKIKLDKTAIQVLRRYDMSVDSIPAEGSIIRLRDNGNLSTGGTARDCTDEIHPYNKALAIRAAQALGLDIAGVDIIAEDISKPIIEENGCVIEVNAAPGLRMHLYPTEGKKRNVAADIIDMMFPEGELSSIPVVSITGTNGKTTTTRLIGHALSLTGKKIGMTSTSGIFIGDECVLEGDNTGPISARMVLSNKEVDAAVLEIARGGIIKRGLGYDLADVGVITNIGDDHLGLDGINTLEELAFAKALVVEAIKPDGYAVLNADDEMTDYLMKRVPVNIVLFSKDSENPKIVNHIKNSGMSVYLEDDIIYIHQGKVRRKLIDVNDIPITFNGKLECNLENSLAAVAALYCLKVPADTIVEGLMTFKENVGRFNVYDLGDFKVMLDYGHNPAGYREVAKLLKQMNSKRLIGIIGAPGDRLDRNIREVGEICGNVFDTIYIKEDRDLRGRKPGEVAKILCEGVFKGKIKRENVHTVLSEEKALEIAILDAQPGDFITMLYEELEPAVAIVNKFKRELEQNTVKPDIMMKENIGPFPVISNLSEGPEVTQWNPSH